MILTIRDGGVEIVKDATAHELREALYSLARGYRDRFLVKE